MLASTRVLLEGILDYAGTFPPAGLPLADAAATYARERSADNGWILGRMVVPAGSLRDLENASEPPFRVSAILGAQSAEQLHEIVAFNERMNGRARVVSVEFPPVPPSDIPNLSRRVPESIEKFFEVPIDEHVEDRVSAIAASAAAAKVRTGGVTASAFPTPEGLVRFLTCCADAGIFFKATAGLHHVVRGSYPLTYDADSPKAIMYGFLNVCVAAALLRTAAAPAAIVDALTESSADAFLFTPDGLRWKDRALGTDELAATRRQLFRSFGSCSIREPIDELARLQLI
jgi:hypothetical protein